MPIGMCYLCGTKGVLVERDHIPPRNLFEKPLPSNLITAPICSVCHRPTHKDDEAFRLFVSGHITRNEKAAKLWRDKVVPRTLYRNRIKDFVDPLRRSIRPAVAKIGDVELPLMTFKADGRPINRVLIWITRGLYWKCAPHIDSRRSRFSTRPI